MIEKLKAWDEQLFIYLNGIHADWLDPVMMTLTGRYIWIPLYLFLIYQLVRIYQKEAVWYVFGIALAILIADQFTSGFMKPFFERLRPCHDPRWADTIVNYAGCGGQYGFASSHAANTFALATYLNLVVGSKRKGFIWLFLWAAVISYTRIYLGVHYPSDILVGAFVGVVAGGIAWFTIQKLKFMVTKHSKTHRVDTDKR
ncbi:phosphatase PAP2 family protein [Negadavirga shengliensis]|uniref:Phosphatase PAP2 family protein n=1 Tax=Negadavirga shengliensis TaxID=1389218 RepID=A0ABV9T830_9BACT